MHELSIVEGIIRVVESERKKHNFSRVNAIEIVCGKYNCLSEENLSFCLNALGGSSLVNTAKVKIKRVEDQFRCLACESEFIEAKGVNCPSCNAEEFIKVNSNSVYVHKLEVD